MRGIEGYYYPRTTSQMLIAVVNMFKNVVVFNYDKHGNITDQLNVELLVNPVESQYRARTYDDEKNYIPTFPRIEIFFNGMNIDESRIISINNERYWNDSDVEYVVLDHREEVLLELNGVFKDFMPLPYNYEYTVKIYTEKIDHYAQIAENIFPYFAMTNSTLRVKEFAFLNIERDINITVGNPDVTIEPETIGNDTVRTIQCVFSVSLAGFMYRKVENNKLIKTIDYASYGTPNEDQIEYFSGIIE